MDTDTKIKIIDIIDIEDSDGKLFAARQVLTLREEELIAAQKAVEEANTQLGLLAAGCLKNMSLKLSFGDLVYVPEYNLTFVGDGECNIHCIGVGISEKYEKLN